MIIDKDDDLHGFQRTTRPGPGWTEVLVSESGQEPVILLHELPSITPEVMHLARVILGAGFKVYLPSFMGKPGRVPSTGDQVEAFRQICVNNQIGALRGGEHTRPAVGGLRILAREVSQENGGAPVGVIGLCLTGGFALATATEPAVRASVACEPSLPISPVPGLERDGIDISRDDQQLLAVRMAGGDLAAMLYRFKGDKLAPCRRLGLCADAFGAGFASRCLNNDEADPARKGFPHHHCVATNHLVEAPGSATLAARDEILAFFRWRLRGAAPPEKPAKLQDCLQTGCARGDKRGPRPREG